MESPFIGMNLWVKMIMISIHLIPQSFLNVPLTVLYEYGGTHEEALKELTNAGFTDIVEGNEL